MTTPWQLHTEQDFYDSISDTSPLTPKGRDAVPVGTVASRIMELQRLAKPSTSNRSRSPVTRRRENGRSGFGRRIMPRFGQPASRSSKPDEEIHIDPKHSFLGLNVHRGNHMEEHALVDARAKWNQTAGLHGQLQPSGLGARVQYDATSPWGILPKGKSRKNWQQDYNKQEIDTLVDSSTKSQLGNMAPMSQLPNSSHHGKGRRGIKQEKSSDPTTQKSRRDTATDQRKAPTSCEWLSVKTTSTMRRQSVKDLYYYYGIQKPAGLVSSESIVFRPKETPRPLDKYKFCHACSWANAPGTINCRCGHSLQRECDSPSPEAFPTSDGSAECIHNVPKPESEQLQEDIYRNEFSDAVVPKQSYPKHQNPNPQLEQQSRQQDLRHQDTSRKHKPRSREEPVCILGTLPALCLEETTPRHGSWETPANNVVLPNTARIYQQTTIALEAQTSIRRSPLPVADALLTLYSNLLPIANGVSQHYSQDVHHDHRHQRECCYHKSLNSNSSSKSNEGSGNDSRDSSGCRATHQGYRPYRHSIICTRKRRRYPEETDSGYIAGASHLEEFEVSQQKNDADPRQVCSQHISSKEHVSELQSKSTSPQSKVDLHRGGQSTQQESDQAHETSRHGRVNQPEGVWHGQEHFHLKEHKESSFTKNAPSLNVNFQSHDRPGIENDHQRGQNASEKSNGCQHRMNDDQGQVCRAGRGQACCYIHNERTKATASVASLVSISPAPPQDMLSELSLPNQAVQSATTISTPKPYVEMKSPDWLTNDTIVPSRNTAKQEILITQQNQSRPDGRKVLSGKREHENPIEVISRSTRNIDQPRSAHSSNVGSEAITQDSHNTMTTVPSTAAEDEDFELCASLYAGLSTDTIPSVSMPPFGDLSPRKFKPASRWLSAFFKLQEQNIVPLLNKRLQDHQEELKRVERMSDNKFSFAVQRMSLDKEQGHEVVGQENKVKREVTEGKSEKKFEHDFSSSSLQLTEQAENIKGLGTAWQEGKQDLLSELAYRNMMGEHQAEEHDCSWKRTAMRDKNGITQEQNLSGVEGSTKLGEKEVSDIGISGVTIVIHLEGRKGVVIKADLSQGI